MSDLKIRIYYADTDCGGVVYHANYLEYMERSRTELLRDAGIDLAEYHEDGLLFAITEANVKYRFPARYDDLITVKTTVTEVTSYRIIFETEIYNQDGKLCTKGIIKMVGFYAETGKVARLPQQVLNILEKNYNGDKK